MTNKMLASVRLYLLVFVMLLFIVGIGVYGMVAIQTMQQNTKTLYLDRLLPLRELTTIRYSYSARILSSAEQVQTAQSSFGEAAQQVAAAEKSIAANWKMYMLTYLTPEEKRLAEQASGLMDQSTVPIQQLKLILNTQDRKALDDFINQQLYPAINPVVEKMSALIDLQVSVGEQVYEKNTTVYSSALKKSIGLIILCVAFALPFSFYLVRNIKHLIENLQESDTRYRNIFDNVQDVFYQTSLTGIVLEVSPSIKNHTGISRAALLGTSALNIYYDAQDREKGIIRLKENGVLTDYEFRLKTNTGEPVYVSLNARLIPGQNGKPGHIDGVFRNITERKKAAEKIIQSEARLKEAQAIAHIGNWEIDMLSSIHLWSDECYKIFGTDAGSTQPSAEALLSFVHPDDLAKVQAEITEAFVTFKDSTANFRFIKQDGSLRYAHTEWKFEFDKRNLPIRLYGILQDITERTIAELSVKQSESNYRQLFECSPAPMWVLDDATHQFMQVNKSCIDHYGYTEEEFAGMTTVNIIPGYNGSEIKNNNTKKNQATSIFAGGHRHIKKSGEIMDMETASIPVVLNGKKQILVVAIDVTERNHYEQKLTRAAIKAQEDERYEIGCELHDNVCQILATSLLFLEMTKKNLPAESIENFELTHQYITLATQEIRNLSHRLAPVFFDDASLQDAFENLLFSFDVEKKYHITLHFDDSVKDYPLSHDLQLNLYRVLQEQLRNILKHANAKSIAVHLTINNNTLQMKIADDGAGFDADKNKGGIGLANMNRRVHLFSGNFRVDSAAGKGCVVLVDIPLPLV